MADPLTISSSLARVHQHETHETRTVPGEQKCTTAAIHTLPISPSSVPDLVSSNYHMSQSSYASLFGDEDEDVGMKDVDDGTNEKQSVDEGEHAIGDPNQSLMSFDFEGDLKSDRPNVAYEDNDYKLANVHASDNSNLTLGPVYRPSATIHIDNDSSNNNGGFYSGTSKRIEASRMNGTEGGLNRVADGDEPFTSKDVKRAASSIIDSDSDLDRSSNSSLKPSFSDPDTNLSREGNLQASTEPSISEDEGSDDADDTDTDTEPDEDSERGLGPGYEHTDTIIIDDNSPHSQPSKYLFLRARAGSGSGKVDVKGAGAGSSFLDTQSSLVSVPSQLLRDEMDEILPKWSKSMSMSQHVDASESAQTQTEASDTGMETCGDEGQSVVSHTVPTTPAPPRVKPTTSFLWRQHDIARATMLPKTSGKRTF
ncbi:hypothetical protein EV361DRAFT_948750 [Lentinula raphanica]|nr:hypothetical protein EV361DRAFT_948750 [Lentinula raphanica]